MAALVVMAALAVTAALVAMVALAVTAALGVMAALAALAEMGAMGAPPTERLSLSQGLKADARNTAKSILLTGSDDCYGNWGILGE
jgi:hypothetical protein